MKWLKLDLGLVFILLLAICLRLPHLNGSFWLDEAAQVLESARPFSQQLQIIDDFQPPLIHYLVHFALMVSPREWWLRTGVALVPGLITIAASYELGKRLINRKAGIVVGLLLATSSLHIFYSQELRPYSLPTMFAVLSWLTLITKSSTKKWMIWTVLTSLGLYSSYLYPFLWLSQLVYLGLFQRAETEKWLLASGVVVLSFTPWLPTFYRQLMAGSMLRQALPGWSEVVSTTQLKTIPLVFGKFVFGVIDLDASWYVLGGLGLLAALGCITAIFLPFKKLRSFSPVWLWLILPPLVAWIVSFWVPVIQPKRVLYLLPALYLAVAWVAEHAKLKKAGQALVLVFLMINIVGTFRYFTEAKLQRENWRELQQTLARHYPTMPTVAVFAFPEPFAPWRWYDQGTYDTISLGYLVDKKPSDITQQLKEISSYDFVITFDYLTDLSDPSHLLLHELENLGYKPLEVIDYSNIGFTRIYVRPGVTASRV